MNALPAREALGALLLLRPRAAGAQRGEGRMCRGTPPPHTPTPLLQGSVLKAWAGKAEDVAAGAAASSRSAPRPTRVRARVAAALAPRCCGCNPRCPCLPLCVCACVCRGAARQVHGQRGHERRSLHVPLRRGLQVLGGQARRLAPYPLESRDCSARRESRERPRRPLRKSSQSNNSNSKPCQTPKPRVEVNN